MGDKVNKLTLVMLAVTFSFLICVAVQYYTQMNKFLYNSVLTYNTSLESYNELLREDIRELILQKNHKSHSNNYHHVIYPVRGRITSGYGWRVNPFTRCGWEFHRGIDIACAVGTPVKSISKGVVVRSGYMGLLGFGVIIKDRDIEFIYGHLSIVLVKKGENVYTGEVIGLSGSTGRSTGPHLHFGIKKGGTYIDPRLILGR